MQVERLRAARAALPPRAAARLDALLFRAPAAASAAQAQAQAEAPSPLDGLFMDEANTVALFKRYLHLRSSSFTIYSPFLTDFLFA
jgi:hypothetical protein